jgi:hypothetical protein
LNAEEVAQGAGKMLEGAGKDGVSGETAGAENGVSEVADELSGVVAFQPHSQIHGRFDRPRVGDFEEHDHILMAPPEGFEILISGSQVNLEALILQGTMQVSHDVGVVGCEEDLGEILKGTSVLSIFVDVHKFLLAFLAERELAVASIRNGLKGKARAKIEIG